MNNMIIGVLIGITSVLAVTFAFGLANAHIADNDEMNMHSMMMSGMMDEMDEDMHTGMHSMMMLDMDEMDEDGDGMCDHCGMSMEQCKMMMDEYNGGGI